jgi:hypothetical protein
VTEQAWSQSRTATYQGVAIVVGGRESCVVGVWRGGISRGGRKSAKGLRAGAA